jgi:uncharacterized DUF497 family protein
MDYVEWSEEKNNKLKKERGIGFEEVVNVMNKGEIIDVIDNPSSNFRNQRVYVLEINTYIYYVPFIKEEGKIFLKTIIPSRKATRKYLKNKKL